MESLETTDNQNELGKNQFQVPIPLFQFQLKNGYSIEFENVFEAGVHSGYQFHSTHST